MSGIVTESDSDRPEFDVPAKSTREPMHIGTPPS